MALAMMLGLSVFTPSITEARGCAAIIFEHRDYRGEYQCLQEGSYNVGDIEIGNDMLSSIKVRDGVTVYLYEHKNFRGKRVRVSQSYRYIGDSWNDRTSSIIVE